MERFRLPALHDRRLIEALNAEGTPLVDRAWALDMVCCNREASAAAVRPGGRPSPAHASGRRRAMLAYREARTLIFTEDTAMVCRISRESLPPTITYH